MKIKGLSVLWLGFGALAGSALPFASSAQATAVTAGTHYFESSNRMTRLVPTPSTCQSTDVCAVIFNVIPAGRQLVVTDVSCRFSLEGNADLLEYVALRTYTSTNAATDRSTYFVPAIVTQFSTPSTARFAVQTKLRHVFKAGERPVFVVDSALTGNFASFDCSISGSLGNPPPE